MPTDATGPLDVDAYIAGFPPAVRNALRAVRQAVREAAPDAAERLAYGMPTYSQGRNLVHFGGFASHVGFYPAPSGVARFAPALARYHQGKGSVRFPLAEPMPLELIRDIVRYRVEEEEHRRRKPRPATPVAKRGNRAATPPMSDAAIRRRSGRTWQAWFDLLHAWGAKDRTHTEIAAWLVAEHEVDAWSAQSITVAFERAHGGRDLGQRPDGFEVSATKTVDVDVATLYRAFMDEALRPQWLPGAEPRLRTATEPKSARFDWSDDGSRVIATFTPKGEAKSSVNVTHVRLPDAEEAALRKAFWRERVAALKSVVEGTAQAER